MEMPIITHGAGTVIAVNHQTTPTIGISMREHGKTGLEMSQGAVDYGDQGKSASSLDMQP